MDNILIKKATVVDIQSPFNGKKVDILIEKGIITQIGKDIKSKTKTVEINNLHVSPGWLDMHANFRDPGLEHQEDLNTGIKAAQLGGYTGVAIMPDTYPCIDSKSGVEYIKNKTKDALVDIYPIGCVSEKHEGKNIAEMYDMHLSGAVAFSDEKQSIQNADLLKRALLYTKQFDGLTIQFANDQNLAQGGQMNEGITSTQLGLKGIPNLAEETMVARDLFLNEYCESRIHFTTISTGKAVDLIKKAKAKQQVSCDVAAYHLFFDDEALETFDSNLKTLPPIRDKKDVKALIKGLNEGVIDVIVSDHQPQDIENKKLEFDHAAFGMIGLQTAFAAVNTAATKNEVELEKVIAAMSSNPRALLKLDPIVIDKGQQANLTLFDPDLIWTFTKDQIASKAKNSPFVDMELMGKPLGIYNKGKLAIN